MTPIFTLPRRQVAIIGGGISGLAAAFELTRTPELRRRFAVTVYESSWRLGGKLASGRNADRNLRNEEHGLHVWFGCYENAFRLAREVFEAWEPPPGSPLSRFEDAFLPHDFTPLGQVAGADDVTAWDFHYPRDADAPGAGMLAPSLLGVVTRLLDGIAALLATQLDARGLPGARFLPRWSWQRVASGGAVDGVFARLGSTLRTLGDRALTEGEAARLHKLAIAARAAAAVVLPRALGSGALAVTLRAPIDFLLTAVCGVLNPRYGVFADGDLDRLDHLDLRQWLRENGARAETVEGPHLRMLYDMCFQYQEGDVARPAFEAGTALRIFLRVHFTYKGAVLYLPRAGMGETIISPLYEVLRARGVRFAFRHALASMELDAAARRLERLRFDRWPLPDRPPTFLHQGLVCWPAQDPAPAAPTQVVSLVRGRDFDDVVLALPAGALVARSGAPSPCEALLHEDARLRALSRQLNLVPTLAAQLWVDRDLAALGWLRRRPALVGAGRPLDVWVDMSHVLDVEEWPVGQGPRGLHYFCGALPSVAERDVEALVTAQLERTAGLWPLARTATGSFDWRALHDPDDREGPARLRAQYVRANVASSDLCDGSAPGTSRWRPEAHESGLENLAFAGTWVRTGFNATCVEAAVMAGMAAARAVAGEGRAIVGERFLRRPPQCAVLPVNRLAEEHAPSMTFDTSSERHAELRE